MPSIILMGIKHSGKTSHARRLSGDLGCAFYDLDDLIEATYRADRLLSCREIYKRHGKEYFYELEAEAARALKKALLSQTAVAALGGGTGENSRAMNELSDAGIFVYLCLSSDTLFERIMRKGLPAFLPEDDPESAFRELYDRRHALYMRYADVVAEIDRMHPDDAYSRLQSTIGEFIDAG